jgi:hypothetical protein
MQLTSNLDIIFLQLLNVLCENKSGYKVAIEAIQKSKAWSTLKDEILKRVAARQMPELQIVALFKAGKYTDRGWNLLRHAMADIVDLPAPSTIRMVWA